MTYKICFEIIQQERVDEVIMARPWQLLNLSDGFVEIYHTILSNFSYVAI